MDSSDDSVRYWVARCLGNFGPRARMAAPKLEQVLAEVDCLQGSKTSASGIRFALGEMGITPPPCKVRHGLSGPASTILARTVALIKAKGRVAHTICLFFVLTIERVPILCERAGY
jgi:hypothetical protein